jgi:uncharacterized protein YutE (UPF0331/DUF86 family)
LRGNNVVDGDILRRRVDALLQYVERLARFASVDRAKFVADPDTHHLAERYLHLAIESAIDIANHLIADAGLETPETYRDAFAILARSGVIETELGQRMQRWAGYRNVLVHAYLTVDHGIAWDAIATDLDDLRQLAAVAAAKL